jgi:hypothetical protein
MNPIRLVGWKLTLLGLLCLSGCDQAKRGGVGGQVKLDGKPVEEGTITFSPSTAGQDLAAWSAVRDGKYSIPSEAGPGVGVCRVEIRAMRSTGKKNPYYDPKLGGLEPEFETEQIVPKRYNSESELTADIKPGDNVLDFDLKTK